MKFPDTPDKLRDEILLASIATGYLRFNQLLNLLKKENVKPNVILEGAISVFDLYQPGTNYQDQKLAGIILQEFNPDTQIEIHILASRVFPVWNKSVHEIPHWFARNYGRSAFAEYLKETLELQTDDYLKDKIKTFLYWLGGAYKNE